MINIPKRKLHIGILVDAIRVSKYSNDIVQWLLKNNDYFDVTLIVQKNVKKEIYKKKYKFKSVILRLHLIINKIFFRFILVCENLLIKFSKKHKNHYKIYDLSKINLNTITLHPNVSEKGNIIEFSTRDIKKVKNQNLHTIIRLGSGILKGEILNTSKIGIISFHHGDNRIYRGGPPGFWEVLHKKNVTGFVLQRLNERLDDGDIILRGNFITEASFLINQANVKLKSLSYLKEFLINQYYGKPLVFYKDEDFSQSKLYSTPNLINQLLYIIYICNLFFSKSFKYIFKFNKKWNVAYLNQNWRKINFENKIIIKNKKK